MWRMVWMAPVCPLNHLQHSLSNYQFPPATNESPTVALILMFCFQYISISQAFKFSFSYAILWPRLGASENEQLPKKKLYSLRLRFFFFW